MPVEKGKSLEIPVNIKGKEQVEKLLKSFAELESVSSDLHKTFKGIFSATFMRDVKAADKNISRLQKTESAETKTLKQSTKARHEADAELRNIQDTIKSSLKPLQSMRSGFFGLQGRFERLIPAGLGLHFGFTNIIQAAHDANMETMAWRQELATMSDVSGSATQALGQMNAVFGMTGASLATVRQNLTSLNAQGINPAMEGFETLAATVTNLSLATGIGAESFSSFAGIMVRNWGVSVGATQRMTSSLLAMQKAFGSTSTEIDMTMKTTGEAMQKMAAFFADGERSAAALTKGIAQTVGVLSKLGVSAQVANEFVAKLMDPEQIAETRVMWSRLGITYQEQIEMMTSSNAKELVFDKLLENLPRVAQQIQAISDPLARMNFAKSIGLPMEIAQKMARATTSNIKQLMKDYKKAAEGDKAMAEKQKNMAVETARFQDILHQMKRDALLPMMKWVNKHYRHFFAIAKTISEMFKKYTTGMVGTFEFIEEKLQPAIDVLRGEGGFSNFLDKLLTGLINIGSGFIDKVTGMVGEHGASFLENATKAAGLLVVKVIQAITTWIPTLMSGITSAWWQIFKKSKLAGIGVAIYGIKKTFGKFVDLTKVFQMAVSQVRHGQQMGALLAIRAAITGEKLSGKTGMLSKLFGAGGKGTATKGVAGKGLASMAGKALPGLGKFAGIIGKAAGPIGLAIGAITGGFTAMGKSADFFGETALDEDEAKRLGELQKKRYLTEKELWEKAKLQTKQKAGPKVTGAMKGASFGAGIATLGIGPLIDSLFGTDLTGELARAFHGLTDKQEDRMKELQKKIVNGKELTIKEQEEILKLDRQQKGIMGSWVGDTLKWISGYTAISQLMDTELNIIEQKTKERAIKIIGETTTGSEGIKKGKKSEYFKAQAKLGELQYKESTSAMGRMFSEALDWESIGQSFKTGRETGKGVARGTMGIMTMGQSEIGKNVIGPVMMLQESAGILGGTLGVLGDTISQTMPETEAVKMFHTYTKMSNTEQEHLNQIEAKMKAGKKLTKQEGIELKQLWKIKQWHWEKGRTLEEQQQLKGLEKRLEILKKEGKEKNKVEIKNIEDRLKIIKEGSARERASFTDKIVGMFTSLAESLGIVDDAEKTFINWSYSWNMALTKMGEGIDRIKMTLSDWFGFLEMWGYKFEKMQLQWDKTFGKITADEYEESIEGIKESEKRYKRGQDVDIWGQLAKVKVGLHLTSTQKQKQKEVFDMIGESDYYGKWVLDAKRKMQARQKEYEGVGATKKEREDRLKAKKIEEKRQQELEAYHKESIKNQRKDLGLGSRVVRALEDKGKERAIDKTSWIMAYIGTRSAIKLTHS